MHSLIDFCALAMVLPYYNKLSRKTVWWGEHVDLMETINVIKVMERLGIAPKQQRGEKASRS